ncbi:MAG: aminopeptidase P family protein [Kiritimatiellia bacterium]|nr:aminopeptidase P family protein [Kiritimatiellia bacterium]
MNGKKLSLHSKRLGAFVRLLKRNRLCGALICGEANLGYLTGFACDHAVLSVDARGHAAFWTDFRYLEAARGVLPEGVALERLTGSRQGLLARLGRQLAAQKGLIGLEECLALGDADGLLSEVGIERYAPISGLLSELRGVKSRDEIARIEAAAKLADEVFLDSLNSGWPGRTEREIAAGIKVAMIARGVEESFETIVAAGANGSDCHHRCSAEVRVQERDAVLVDMGVRLDGYCSDMTRCVSFGKPSALYRKIYALVLEANCRAIEAIRPGIPCCEVDAVARGVIEKAGYGKAFGHSLGHSVGLEIHESPAFSPTCRTVLKPGMVITVEPGIYLPGRLGIRIEDFIVVTGDGCRILTGTPKELLVI